MSQKDTEASDDNISNSNSNSNNNLYTSAAYEEALEDVHTRFILNLPETELQTADRIFFQLEQAWWFYEDWICDAASENKLPRFSNLKPFAQQLFCYSPLLPDPSKFNSMWNEFSKYKQKISNYGCILLSQDCQRVVLCQLWNSQTHTFPAGKINQGEDGLQAAARECYEETGFDPLCKFGLTAEWKHSNSSSPNKITWKRPGEDDALTVENDKRRTCFVCHAVPQDFPFEPVARKEVSSVSWYTIDNLPKRTYSVLPFLPQLKRWIRRTTGDYSYSSSKGDSSSKTPTRRRKTPHRDRDRSRNNSNKRASTTTPKRRHSSRPKARTTISAQDDDLVQSGLAQPGQVSGWSEQDMFAANERLLGRKIEYDGNPHVFEQGFFGGNDPHAFHVVGGTFLNATTTTTSTKDGSGSGNDQRNTLLAPAPETSQLQPLFRRENNDDDDDDDDSNNNKALKPFFSSDGATPWGEVVQEVAADADADANARDSAMPSGREPHYIMAAAAAAAAPTTIKEETTQDAGEALLHLLHGGAAAAQQDDGSDGVFLTDAEITAKSQATKQRQQQHRKMLSDHERRAQRLVQYESDMEYIHQWVANNLPKPRRTKHFGLFKLDADALLAAATTLQAPSSSSSKK